MAPQTVLPPPALPVERGGGDSEWVELMRARDAIDAHLVQGLLVEAGVETRSVKDNTAPVWMYGGSDPWSPVVIMVRRFQFEEARIVLAEIAFDAPAEERPPSRRVPGYRGRLLLWWLIAVILGAIITTTLLMQAMRPIDRCQLAIFCVDDTAPARTP